jgi:hypothetical protein
VDEGDGFKIRSVAANILNKKLQRITKDCPPGWVLGRQITILHYKGATMIQTVMLHPVSEKGHDMTRTKHGRDKKYIQNFR